MQWALAPANEKVDFLKVLRKNSWFRHWKGRPFTTYVARARPRDFVALELRSTCGKSNEKDFPLVRVDSEINARFYTHRLKMTYICHCIIIVYMLPSSIFFKDKIFVRRKKDKKQIQVKARTNPFLFYANYDHDNNASPNALHPRRSKW